MATMKDQVKESLVGTSREPLLSAQTRANFERHARRDEESGELYMGVDELVNAVAPKDEDYHKIGRETYAILFQVADRRKLGKVNLQDWASFEQILLKPDAEYEIAFRLFDKEGTGRVRYTDFVKLFNENRGEDSIPFDWNCEWATLYIGGKRMRHDMSYPEFSQMLRGLQGERIRQAFHHFDKDGTGFIQPADFQRIILDTTKHKLSDHLLENLPSLCNISTGSKISYANVRAFQNMIREMDLVSVIIRNATKKSSDGKISRADFLNEAARITKFSLITPMEADILFHFAGLEDPSGRLGYENFARVLDSSWRDQYVKDDTASGEKAQETDFDVAKMVSQAKESIYHFALGSVAGAFGAFMVYPIDLVKTRMQNQRKIGVGQAMYKNSLDCASKVLKNEGIRGFYSGVGPQLIGVAPEKAIKLTVNDFVRGKFTDSKGNIWWPHELLAGGSAGACQVVFTNPLEIVKIRLQVQGELAKTAGVPKRSAMWIVRNLGVMGLYKGASACLLRDVPFSAIYFPGYNHLKRDMFGEGPNKKLGILQLLTAGAIAGMPAAYLTTPCDVIKTRLQVEARANESSYTSLRHCAATIYKEEGFRAFFKGGPARILRSSPQFGFTLAAYELLQSSFPYHAAAESSGAALVATEPTTAIEETKAPLPYLRSRNALKILLDLDENFGRAKENARKEGWGSPFAGVFGSRPKAG